MSQGESIGTLSILLTLSLSHQGVDGTLKVNEHPDSSHTHTHTSNYLRQN